MYSADRRDVPVLKMTGRTLDECKAKLFEKFNNEYTIRGKRTMLKGGFSVSDKKKSSKFLIR